MNPPSPLSYCNDLLLYSRRPTREVLVGNVAIGGNNPIRVQSMITADTRDTDACVSEIIALADAGCEIVRITAQTKVYAANLEHITRRLHQQNCFVPLVADIHFKPDAAFEAAKWVDKIRVNPGNYSDKKRFLSRDYTDAEYQEEIDRIYADFAPLVKLCKDRNRAMRIGTNHGSLSDRIMNRYGDTPHGMVESALEFARIARDLDYHNLIFSMKASNPKVMIEAYRLLVAHLNQLGPDWNYPIHLGVTEAGDGEDGRIKSAIGIGSLLADGIGDTIRVSLTEDSIYEIPVAQAMVAPYHDALTSTSPTPQGFTPSYDPFSYSRRPSSPYLIQGTSIGNPSPTVVVTTADQFSSLSQAPAAHPDFKPEVILESSGALEVDPLDPHQIKQVNQTPETCLVTVSDHCPLTPIAAFRLLAAQLDPRHPILLKDALTRTPAPDSLSALLRAAQNIGSLLCDGIGDAILVRSEASPQKALQLSYNILQAAGTRIYKTDYVACPSCGRTLFNLQSTTQKIRSATGHLKGVRIAVMGCIVNGPGEMADADFGYVGGAPGKINLYVGKTPVEFNIDENQAVDRLILLIQKHNRWIDPPSSSH